MKIYGKIGEDRERQGETGGLAFHISRRPLDVWLREE